MAFRAIFAAIMDLNLSHRRSRHGLEKTRLEHATLTPAASGKNGYIESFRSRFRDECLNREWLLNLREARVVIEDWRQHYNEERPHSRLGYLTPETFLANQKVSPEVGQNR